MATKNWEEEKQQSACRDEMDGKREDRAAKER